MKNFNSYIDAENYLIRKIVKYPHFVTASTYEVFAIGFTLLNPANNKNTRSNYDYAQKFFEWMLTGEKQLSPELLAANPWVERFVDTKGLPDSFSASYGWKIKEQEDIIINELKANRESRRAYYNILIPDDHIVMITKTTHEYPCTIGLHFFIRENALHLIVNMRSNNVYAVMPYDVYNFTMYQNRLAKKLNLKLGIYYHQINNAHLYKGDVRRIEEAWKK